MLCLLLVIPVSATGRIVNTQDKLFAIHDNGLYLDTELALNWLTGTAEVLQFTGAVGSHWLMEPHLFFLAASGTFARKDDERFINKYFIHGRYRYRIWKFAMMELFVQGEYNEFRRIRARMPCGVGPRIQQSVGEHAMFQFAFGSSYMFEWVNLSKDRDEAGVLYGDSLSAEYNHRWNNYISFKLDFAVMSLCATVYVQPRFDDFGDWMMLIESDLSFKVTEKLAVSFAYTLFHDSRPPEGVINRDTSLTAVLKIALGPWFSRTAPEKPTQTVDALSGS